MLAVSFDRDIFMTINFAEGCGSQDIRIEIRYVGDNNHAPVVNISGMSLAFLGFCGCCL